MVDVLLLHWWVAVFPIDIAMQMFEDDKQYPVLHNTFTVEEEVPNKESKRKMKNLKESLEKENNYFVSFLLNVHIPLFWIPTIDDPEIIESNS